jgi:hypothetical protein
MQKNFFEKTFYDTVYITANPFASRIPDETFHHIITPNWSKEYQTVLPETVVDATREMITQYPNKRLLIHFMQPHFPFIGPKGQSIDHRGYDPENDSGGPSFSVWDELQYGVANYDVEEVIDAYEENLDIVLEQVSKLLPALGGRTVVSSDHGNLLGERIRPIPVRTFGHPAGLRSEPLIKVPWFIIGRKRRQITSEEPTTEKSIDDSIVEDRLTALGYAE